LNYSPNLRPNQIGGSLDTPAMIVPMLPNSQTINHTSSFNLLDSYPSEFFLSTLDKSPSRSIESLMNQPVRSDDTSAVLPVFRYTHPTAIVVASQVRSQYAAPSPMPDKVSKQIAVAEKIQAVDVDGLVSSLLNNYLVREIINNLDAYASQKFRCKGCGEVYRRPPLRGTCLTCGRELLPTVTLAAVEKYALLAGELIKSHRIPQPIKDKVSLVLENLQLLSESKKQTSIADFV
jgi:DNA polymerase II large subunit